MPRNESRKYDVVVDYIEDAIGADVDRDLLKVAIEDSDSGSTELPINLNEISGTAQSAVDVANKIDEIEDALTSVGGDQLRVDLENYNGGTLPTEQQSPVGIEGSGGAQLDPATQALEAALKANDTDEFVSRITDSSGTEVDPMNQDALQAVAGDELRSRIHDSTGAQIDPARKGSHDTVYTSIDLNTSATTTVYDPSTDAEVEGIHLSHGGSTAELLLEITDGTNTAVLQDPAAGEPIHYPDPLHLNTDDSIQVVVEVVEGAALSETAVVSEVEY